MRIHAFAIRHKPAMESDEMVLIPRLNALVRKTDLHVVIMEAVQKMGYDQPSDSKASAISHFVRGNDVFISQSDVGVSLHSKIYLLFMLYSNGT